MPRLLRGAVVLLVLAVAASCGDGGDVADGREERDVGVYAAVVLDVARDVPVPPEGERSDRLVFVDALDPDREIPLEIQAGVVVELEDEVEVVFIDAREEALEDAEEDGPVREGAALVAVGPVLEDGSQLVVEALRELGQGGGEALSYVVEPVGAGWEVAARRPPS